MFYAPLQKGDKVGLVSPSSPVTEEKMNLAVKHLGSLGFEVIPGKHTMALPYLDLPFPYLAGEAKSRAEEINQMFADSQIKAIFCMRGGYGSSQIMPYLDYELIGRNPKIFVGYSDITNLHTALNQICHMVTFHGPMPASNFLDGMDAYTCQSFFSYFTAEKTCDFANPENEDGFQVISEGEAEGILTGGNLSVLARSVGTFYQMNASGKILFLEEINESIPVIDMLLTQLEQTGGFKEVKGILFGDFTNCKDGENPPKLSLEDFLIRRFSNLKIPVMCHLRSGHNCPMGTLPFGAFCRMNTYLCKITFFNHL